MKLVVTSGYFNPIHKGHIELLKEAKRLGDILIVIVNTDRQVELKGSKPFMDEIERLEIVKSVRYVDLALLSIDIDGTQAKTLEVLKPDIFAKGGDRNPEESPLPQSEIDICTKHNIKIIYGVGGRKVQSSSNLLRGKE